MTSLYDSGIRVVLFLQSLGGLEVPMRFFTYIGTPDFFVFVLPVVYWCIDASLGIRIGFILLVSNGLNEVAKLALQGETQDLRPRARRPCCWNVLCRTQLATGFQSARNAQMVMGREHCSFPNRALVAFGIAQKHKDPSERMLHSGRQRSACTDGKALPQ